MRRLAQSNAGSTSGSVCGLWLRHFDEDPTTLAKTRTSRIAVTDQEFTV
jgi:hypothetical protein